MSSIRKFIVGVMLTAVALVMSASSASADWLPINIGDVYAGVNNGNIQHYNSALTLLETSNTGQGGYTTGMAFDSSRNMLSTNFSAGNISQWAVGGGVGSPPVFVSGLSVPESITFDKAGNFYVSQVFGTGPNKYNSAGVYQTTLTAAGRTDWVDLAADQKTLYYTDEGSAIHRIDASTNTPLSDFASGLPGSQAFAFRILSDGGVLIADNQFILRLDSSGAVVQTYTASDETTGFFALNIDPDGTSFFTGSFDNDKFYKFDIASGAQLAEVDTGLGGGNLFGLAVAGEKTVGVNPIPEPASLTLAGMGVVSALGFVRCRRNRRSA